MPTLTYLDYNATTPIAPTVLDQMLPWMTERFWNAASSHAGGRASLDAVEAARRQIAARLGTRASAVVWTSGATEANNLALKGVAEAGQSGRRRVVSVATEHKAVLDTVGWLAANGIPTTVLGVDRQGRVDLDQLVSVLELGDVALVSIMAANNETGVVPDLGSIASLVHDGGALLHSDLTQAVGRMPLDLAALGIDLASLSAHKIYGPKGVGALVCGNRVPVAAQMHGGGHERGLRSGTLDVPGIVGFGAAMDLVTSDIASEGERQRALLDRFLAALSASLDALELIGDPAVGLPNTLSVRITGADAEAVMVNAPSVAISSGSACTARVPGPSHVLTAMGRTPDEAMECLRISVGRMTTITEIDDAAAVLGDAGERVRRMTA